MLLRALEIIGPTVVPASRTERSETATARSGMEIISRLTGEITSPGNAQPTGIETGTGIATISGMATVAVLSTARGSSSISDSRGIRTVIPTITTRTIIIRTNMTRALTKATQPIIQA